MAIMKQLDDDVSFRNNEPNIYQPEENKTSDDNDDNGTDTVPPGLNVVNTISEGDPPKAEDKLTTTMDEDRPGDFPQVSMRQSIQKEINLKRPTSLPTS